jgi:antitoxin component of RelBE/YafQ-DinJ toxin-antitoxin module
VLRRSVSEANSKTTRMITPLNISISDVIYVDFPGKRVIDEQKLPFEKLELVREGLINYDRLFRRGDVRLVYEKAG